MINDRIPSPIQIWHAFRHRFCLDFYLRYNNDIDVASAHALQQISHDLDEHGFSLEDYGLPQPSDQSNEVEHELLHWSSSVDHLSKSADHDYKCLFDEQREIYDRIMHAIVMNSGLCQFIDGRAGRGKTFLVNALCDRLRSRRHIVLATATSAFAAQQYRGGRTTHSTFKVSFFVYLDTI